VSEKDGNVLNLSTELASLCIIRLLGNHRPERLAGDCQCDVRCPELASGHWSLSEVSTGLSGRFPGLGRARPSWLSAEPLRARRTLGETTKKPATAG
jgi:hypothetical protein